MPINGFFLLCDIVNFSLLRLIQLFRANIRRRSLTRLKGKTFILVMFHLDRTVDDEKFDISSHLNMRV